MALLEFFSAQLMDNFEDNFFFVLFHFVLGRYGHSPVQQTYAVELQALTDSLMFWSPGQLSIGPDPARDPIPYIQETIPEDEFESFSEEEGSEDNKHENNSDNNCNSRSDNDTV